jgi:hypothetical protein
MLTTQEAKAQNVSGVDVFFSEHIGYISDLNRDWTASQLLAQAILFANDTTIVKHRQEREVEIRLWREYLKSGGLVGRDPHPPMGVSFKQINHWKLDCFKLGAAFELALKARLLRKGFLLHLVKSSEKDLAKRQRTSPIAIAEFTSKVQTFHNGQYNFFPSLLERTITFDTLLKEEAYLSALDLSTQHAAFFEELRRLRNLVHMPLSGEHVATPVLASLGEDFHLFLFSCLNTFIVEQHNEICLPGRQEPYFQ